MATDGVKIIDGDRAHDTYWGMMDLYDSGADFSVIENEYPLVPTDSVDDFDTEIYVTACALALWEMGRMTDEKLQYIRTVVDKGACVAEWSTYSPADAKGRQKELDKFWKKISAQNEKIRARKKHREITKLYLAPDDVLTFKLADGRYGAVICASVDQHRGQCNYILVPTTYVSPDKPSIESLKRVEILGRQIETSFDQDVIRARQSGIERIWNFESGRYFFGVMELAIDHKSFAGLKDKFERIGSLKIVEGLKRSAIFGYASTFDRFESIFKDIDDHARIFQLKKYPISVVCEL